MFRKEYESMVKVQVRVKGWNGVKGCHPSGGDRKEIDRGPQRETFITLPCLDNWSMVWTVALNALYFL